jgi:hypothetical protein
MMTNQEIRTFAAAVILSGQLANKERGLRDIEIHEAISTADTLLEAVKNPASLNKRIAEYCKSRGYKPPKPLSAQHEAL